jgi:hypothetical protein
LPRIQKKIVKRTNDEIREMMLKFFYDVHKKASSRKRIRLKISEVKRRFRDMGIKSVELMSNLDYLIQTGFIVREEEIRQIRTNKGVFPSKTSYYKASDKTMDYFNGSSKFQRIDRSISGINVTNIQGVTNIVAGDSNVIINSQYIDLYKNLDLLSEVIQKSGSLNDEEKLNFVGEINTIKAQLTKTKPDRDIIRRAWDKLKTLATVSGIISFFEQVVKLIGVLL